MAGQQAKTAIDRRTARILRSRRYARRIAFLLTLLATPADACHIYRVWHYPKPQRCFTALAPPNIMRRSHNVLTALPERIEISLPTLEWIDCPSGDERLLGIAKLRALEDVPAAGH